MEEFKNNTNEISGKPKTSMFNRSLTMNLTIADSLKKPYLYPPTLERAGSIKKLYNSSFESMVTASTSIKGKVNKLRNLFESPKPPTRLPDDLQLPPPAKSKLAKSDSRVSSILNNSLIRLTGTEDRIVVYFTSLHGIRRTFEDCYAVRMIFRGFRIYVDERDISMDSAYRKELQSVLGEKNVSLPQVFIRGKYVGGADVIKQLHETGELAKILNGFRILKPGYVCDGCADNPNNAAALDNSTPENHLLESLNLPENNFPLPHIPPENLPHPPDPTPKPHVSDSQHEDSVDAAIVPVTENPNPDQTGLVEPGPIETGPPVKKRRRRKKLFPEMISSAKAVHGLRVLRPHVKSSVYSDKLMDEIIQMQITDSPSIPKNRRRRIADITKEVDVEALIAISVGFPVDSLTEEEIEANTVSQIGGDEQANYIVVRNHILARWRSNVSMWMTKDQALESIRIEHKGLVDSAYNFLLEHGYINFGLAPAIKEAKLAPPNGVEKANVVVVGAGLSGLVAARQLVSLGFKVVVLEGRSRPGGRVKTKKMKGGSVEAAADIGGSVLTGINGNPLGVLARQLGLPLHKVRDICPLYLPDGRAVNSEIDSSVEVAFNKLLDRVCKLREVMMEELKSVDVSLGTALEAFRGVYKVADNSEERMLLNWHLANLEYANASLMSDLSMVYWDQDDPYEMGGDHCFIPGGNERFVRALAEDLPIFYDRTVESIRYGVDGAMAYAGGQEFRGDMVLCTVPLGVLKKGLIEFVPELPQRKKDVIQRLGFGLLNKVAMLFPYDFWGGEIDTFGHLTENSSMRGEFFLFYSYASVSGGPLLVALVAGEAAIKFEMMSPLESITRVLDILRGIFNPKGIQVPDPIQVVCTRWGEDRFAYGSYSYVAIGSSGDDYDILAESVGDGRVFFAGEATNKQYPATMHGAFLSGMREAANILRMANKRSIIPAHESKNATTTTEEHKDLNELFATPDMKFGSFAVLHDPRSNELDSSSLLRAEFKSGKSDSSSLFLYSLIPRKQVIELSHLDGDGNRMKILSSNFGVRLVGRKGLCSAAESLITCIKSARLQCS